MQPISHVGPRFHAKVSLRGRWPEAISFVRSERLLRRSASRNDMSSRSFSRANQIDVESFPRAGRTGPYGVIEYERIFGLLDEHSRLAITGRAVDPLWKMAAPSYAGVTSPRRKPGDAGPT